MPNKENHNRPAAQSSTPSPTTTNMNIPDTHTPTTPPCPNASAIITDDNLHTSTLPHTEGAPTEADAPAQSVATSQALSSATTQAHGTASSMVALPELVYYHTKQSYYMKMRTGKWVELKLSSLKTHLIESYGFSGKSNNGTLSPADQAVYHIEEFQAVDFVGAIGGFRMGRHQVGSAHILIDSEPTFIVPQKGEWDMLRGILENMLGTVQVVYLYGWLKMALQMFKEQTWMAGQALVLCGPPASGKNLLAFLIQKLFGGREPGKPYDFMTQGTTFNGDVIGAELLTIEDEVTHTNLKKRLAFGAKIKGLAVNKAHRVHKKFMNGITATPLQRLVISLNDEPERVIILPPIEPDIADKMMIFKVEKHDMPMPTDTPAAEKAFGDALLAQLPAFVDFLDQWEIPSHLKASRMGITHYHHPDILEMLGAQSPEAELLRLIDEVLFPAHGVLVKPWHGKAADLERTLLDSKNYAVQREVRRLLPSRNCCGRYLARLVDPRDGRVTKHPGHAGIHNWTINPPAGSLLSGFPSSMPNAANHPMILKIKSAMEAKGSSQETMEVA